MFSLEAAVGQWHRKIRKNPALEDGYIAELESPLREDISQYIRLGHAEEEAFDKAVGNIGPIGIKRLGYDVYIAFPSNDPTPTARGSGPTH